MTTASPFGSFLPYLKEQTNWFLKPQTLLISPAMKDVALEILEKKPEADTAVLIDQDGDFVAEIPLPPHGYTYYEGRIYETFEELSPGRWEYRELKKEKTVTTKAKKAAQARLKQVEAQKKGTKAKKAPKKGTK